ncbi:MAG: hypothetical protein COB41_02590 [Proteobacteria bacterium]|nr:MAG: hypothetical protein COB41_02590 [Pseudomonadota bacterium]
MNKYILKQFQSELEETLRSVDIIDHIVISSLDGIAVTHASRKTQAIDSIAARSASFLSLGDIWEDSSGNLSCDNVIMESKTGTVVVIHMGSKLLLCMATTSDATTGLVLHQAKSCVDRLLQITQSVIQLGKKPPLVDSILHDNIANVANG